MAKYDFEFKKKVVEAYLRGEGGYQILSKKFGLKSTRQIGYWVKAYKKFGDEGLKVLENGRVYPFELKLLVVESYLKGNGSYSELGLKYEILNHRVIGSWVKKFKKDGPETLKNPQEGREYTVEYHKKRPSKPKKQMKITEEEFKRIEEENYHLRMENDFFKSNAETEFRGRSKNERTARVIDSLREKYKLKDLLEYAGMAKSTFMYWQKRFDRENPDKDMEEKILEIRSVHKDYGYRRIHAALCNEGYCINKKKVQRIIQNLKLQVTSFTRKSRKYNSYQGTIGVIAPNRIKRRFHTSIPHQKITTDTTEFKYYEVDERGNRTLHKLYLDPFMDMFNNEILSYNITKHPSVKNILDVLDRTIKITSDCIYRRTFHSDQGWAYQLKEYSSRLKDGQIFQSMSRKGTCLDNSIMENFFSLLKQEVYYGRIFYSYEELKNEIERFIKYYNENRIKEKLGWMSPVQYRIHCSV